MWRRHLRIGCEIGVRVAFYLGGVLVKTCQRGAKIVRSLRFVICNFYLKSRFKNRGARFDLILFGIYSIYKIALNTLKYILKVTANH